jgi:hypothetical protein
MHIVDWAPTILDALGLDTSLQTRTTSAVYDDDTSTSASGSTSYFDSHDIDGVSHWAQIQGSDDNEARTEVLLNIDTYMDGNMTARPRGIIVGDYKLVYEYQIPYFKPMTTNSFDTQDSKYIPLDCVVDRTGSFKKFVYDIVNDPYELVNIKDTIDADTLDYMERRLRSYTKDASISCFHSQDFGKSLLAAWEDNGDYIVPWKGESYQDCYASMLDDDRARADDNQGDHKDDKESSDAFSKKMKADYFQQQEENKKAFHNKQEKKQS